jgi:hypothetical protein
VTTEDGGEETESEEPSSSSLSTSPQQPTLVTSPTSALESFRREWEAELKKITVPSNVHSALNLANTSSASLNNPYPNPTSMAGAVSMSKSPLKVANSGKSEGHPFAVAGAAGLVGQDGGVGGTAQSPGTDFPPASVPAGSATVEEQARQWFLQGIGFERHGDLFDAVRCYRRAVQLVPDIEYRISAGLIPGHGGFDGGGDGRDAMDSSDEEEDSEESDSRLSLKNEEGAEDAEEEVVLICRFLKSIEKHGWQFFTKANKSDKKAHLGDLPVEVVSYIMRYLYLCILYF